LLISFLEISSRIALHSPTISNRMPIYKWLVAGTRDVDLSEDCHQVSIARAIEQACENGYRGKLLPVIRYTLILPFIP
jgi:hypothetical protein